MAKMYRVKFLRRHKQFQPGETHEFLRGVADMLVRCHKAEWVNAADAPVLQTATATPGGEQQVVKRKRGRPRKHPVVPNV